MSSKLIIEYDISKLLVNVRCEECRIEARNATVYGGRIVSTSSRNYHGVQDWIGKTGFSRARAQACGRRTTRLFMFPSRNTHIIGTSSELFCEKFYAA